MTTKMLIRSASILLALLLTGTPALNGVAYAGAGAGKEAAMEKAKAVEEVQLKDEMAAMEKIDAVKGGHSMAAAEGLLGEEILLEELGLLGIEENAVLGD